MRLGTLSILASSLLGMANIALAQTDPDDAPLPPAPSQPMPRGSENNAPMMGTPMPAWQAPPGGYGGWYAGYGDGHHGDCCQSDCCHSDGCGSCCRKCRPGLLCRLKALKCKMAAARACRRACRTSCCSSCCSSCCGDGMPMHDMPTEMHHGDLLPVPPAEPTPYRGDDDSMQDDSVNRPTAAMTPVAKRQYSMPRATATRKSATRTTYRR